MNNTAESNTNVIPLHSEKATQGRLFSGDILREQIHLFTTAHDVNQKTVARESGISSTTYSQWLGSKYPGNNEEVEDKLSLWLAARQRRDAEQRPQAPERFASATSEKIMSALTMAQIIGQIVCIYGGAGVGKTVTLRHYRRTNPAVWIATMSPNCAGLIPALEEIADALGMRETPQGARKLSRAISNRVESTRGLLVIDEAQHLSVNALEEIRAIHDRTGIGLALVGNESVFARLTGGSRASHFAQLFSRVGVRLFLKRPVTDDVSALAEAWGISGPAEIDFLTQLAQKPGALRGVTNMLLLASMARGKGPLTLPHLRQAWANLGAQE